MVELTLAQRGVPLRSAAKPRVPVALDRPQHRR